MKNSWNVSAEELTQMQNLFLTAFHNKQTEIEGEKINKIINALTGNRG